MATGTQLEKSAPPKPGQPQGQSLLQSPFMNRLVALAAMARVRWAQMAPAQRSGVLVAALLLASATGVLLWYGLRPDWRTLYMNMDPDDARQTSQILTQAQIPFDVTPDGTGIRVPAAQLDKARLATAAKGGIKSGRLGFELFDKPNWVGSEFDEHVNYQRALEGELEHTVGTLSDVESARVHLVLPHDSLFREDERPAKASVVLKLRHRALADGEADAIRNLVASAVDGLTPDHVVLVDADGHLPLGPKTDEAMRLSEEQALEEKLISTLEPVTGAGNVRASVTLDYVDTATDVTQESYDPTQTVTLSMQRSEQTTGPQQVAAGVAGTTSNAPNAQALPVYPRQTAPPESAKTESGTYGVSKTVRHLVENPGRVRRMTAAIVVNDRLVSPASHGNPAAWQPRSAAELSNLTALAQAAVGFDASRGDTLTVEDLPFDANRVYAQTPLPEQMLATAEDSPLLIKYGALLLGLIVVVAFGVRPALRYAGSAPAEIAANGKTRELSREQKRELPGSAASGAAGALGAVEPIEIDPERRRSQEIFEQVTEQLKREPTQSSRLLQSWIHSD